jgi:aryl-alcohol dehydrogenase-like predicted oxidoreductase
MKTAPNTHSRREFSIAASTLAAGLVLPGCDGSPASDKLGPLLPQRRLGKTGLKVTSFCPGGMHIEWMKNEADSARAIEYCIEQGARFFDTAVSYGKGRSEELYGKYLTPKYREYIKIMTKSRGTTGAVVREEIEGSLKRMKTDYIDIYMMHSIVSAEDANGRIKNGVLDVLREYKEKGVIGHFGFTGHFTPKAHNYLLSKNIPDIEVCLLPVNVADPSYDSFVLNTVPELVKQDIGICAMKTLANGGLHGGVKGGVKGEACGTYASAIPDLLSVREAHSFSLSLPISAIVSGVNNLDQLKHNIETVRTFKPLSEAQREELIARCAGLGKTGEMEFYKWPKMKFPGERQAKLSA